MYGIIWHIVYATLVTLEESFLCVYIYIQYTIHGVFETWMMASSPHPFSENMSSSGDLSRFRVNLMKHGPEVLNRTLDYLPQPSVDGTLSRVSETRRAHGPPPKLGVYNIYIHTYRTQT